MPLVADRIQAAPGLNVKYLTSERCKTSGDESGIVFVILVRRGVK
jgi:hypothetical protein